MIFSYSKFLRHERGLLLLGRDDTGPVWLHPKHLATGILVLAAPGGGKSFLIRNLVRQLLPQGYLLRVNDRKGELVDMLIEDFAALGLVDRMDILDTTRSDRILHLNPYASNGLHPRHHALSFTRNVLSCWGQRSGTMTPQMIRQLYNSVEPVIEFQGSIKDSLEMLNYENKAARRRLLARSSDSEVKEEWRGFEHLSPQRRREETAPAYARLKRFLQDPVIEKCLTGYPSFDVAESFRRRRHCFWKIVANDPLERENADLLESIVNEMEYMTEVRVKDRPPVVHIFDEAEELFRTNPELIKNRQTFGRTQATYSIYICHNLQQIAETDPGMLAQILSLIRTKILGPGVSYNDLKLMAPELWIDQWNSQIIRFDTILPVGMSAEESREIVTHSEQEGWSEESSASTALGKALMASLTLSEQRGNSSTQTDSEGEHWDWTHGETDAEGDHEDWSIADSSGVHDDEISTASHTDSKWKNAQDDTGGEADTSGGGKSHGSAASTTFTRSGGRNRQHTSTDTEAFGRSRQRSLAVQESFMRGVARQLANTIQQITTHGSSQGRNGSKGISRQVVPFTKTYYQNMVTSRQFLESQPFLEEKIAMMRRLKNRGFAIKVMEKRTIFFRSEDVKRLLRDPVRIVALWDTLLARAHYGDLQKPGVQVLLPEDDDDIEY